MDVTATIKKFGLEKAFNYLYKDPDENLKKMLKWAERFSGKTYKNQIDMIRDAVENKENAFHPYIEHLLERADPEVVKTLSVNFFINENMIGYPKQKELKEKYNCNIPWAILLDPTSACNLHCIGCWAAEYGNKLNLTYEEMDSIITQGKDMGCYIYLFTGGEPLVRKDDIIRLCEKHNDCVFSTFTNGTLIDEKFADEMLRVKNFAPAISLEGMEEATDSRRGPPWKRHVREGGPSDGPAAGKKANLRCFVLLHEHELRLHHVGRILRHADRKGCVFHLVFPLPACGERRGAGAAAHAGAAGSGLPPDSRIPEEEAAVRHRLPERRGVRRRMHRRRASVLPHQRQR